MSRACIDLHGISDVGIVFGRYQAYLLLFQADRSHELRLLWVLWLLGQRSRSLGPSSRRLLQCCGSGRGQLSWHQHVIQVCVGYPLPTLFLDSQPLVEPVALN